MFLSWHIELYVWAWGSVSVGNLLAGSGSRYVIIEKYDDGVDFISKSTIFVWL